MHQTLSQPRNAKACSQYQALELNSRLEAASPHRLVSILYEELARAIDIIVIALGQGHRIATHTQVDRARTILISLEASLDFRSGGSLATSLATVYRSMRKELAMASQSNDPVRLEALRAGVDSISQAWANVRH